MSSSFLEIIELDDGEIALRRADQENEPLVNIRFADLTKTYIDKESRLEVAKVMIQAGIQAAAHITGVELRGELSPLDEDDLDQLVEKVVH